MTRDLSGKKVLVIGAGISGFAAAKLAKRFGAEVVLSDAKQEKEIKYDFQELRDADIMLVFGPQQESLLDDVDMVIVSPAVPERIPLVQAAYRRKIRVLTEVEMAYELAESPICAVTGTNGKTTTVTLLGQLLTTKFQTVGVGGNIGVPLSEEVLRVGRDGCIAAEISSYQMEITKNFRPHVAAELNITPDHIVRHGSLNVYQQMKEKLFAQQTAEDFLVLNYDDEHTRSMEERAAARICYFSRKVELKEGVFVKDDRLVIRWEGQEYQLCAVKELGIRGGHNVENALAAAAVAFLAGCEPMAMVPILREFRGVEHRIEYVRELGGVAYYNDSKATNTDSAIKALETFADGIVLLAGGDDKMTDLTEFMQMVCQNVADLILVGEAADRFEREALANGYPAEHIHRAGFSMEKAVAMAHTLAKAPQVVLLSPACASFDMYDGMAERGRDFKRLVNNL